MADIQTAYSSQKSLSEEQAGPSYMGCEDSPQAQFSSPLYNGKLNHSEHVLCLEGCISSVVCLKLTENKTQGRDQGGWRQNLRVKQRE